MGSRLSQRYWDPNLYAGAVSAVFTGNVLNTTMTVSSITSPNSTIAVDDLINGGSPGGGNTVDAIIDSFGTGTGGVGTYELNDSYDEIGTLEEPVVFTARQGFPDNNIIMPFAYIAGNSGVEPSYILRQLSSSTFLVQGAYTLLTGECTLSPNTAGYLTPGEMYIGMYWYNYDGAEGYWQSVREINDNTAISFDSGFLGTPPSGGGEGWAYQQDSGSWEISMPWTLNYAGPQPQSGFAQIWTNSYFYGP